MKRHHTPYFLSSLVFSLPPQVFVCVHNHGPCFKKLDPRSTKCVFLGYSQAQKGYRCYFLAFQRYFRIADVTFDESSHISLVFVLLRNTILSLWPVLFRFQSLVLYTFHRSSASNSSSSIRSIYQTSMANHSRAPPWSSLSTDLTTIYWFWLLCEKALAPVSLSFPLVICFLSIFVFILFLFYLHPF